MLSLALCLVALSPLAQDRRPVELPAPSGMEARPQVPADLRFALYDVSAPTGLAELEAAVAAQEARAAAATAEEAHLAFHELERRRTQFEAQREGLLTALREGMQPPAGDATRVEWLPGGKVAVLATPEQHAWVQTFVARPQSFDGIFDLTAVLWSVPPGAEAAALTLRNRERMPASEAKKLAARLDLLGAERISAPRVLCYAFAPVELRAGEELAYVSDWEFLELTDREGSVASPVVATAFDGFDLRATCFPLPGGRVQVHVGLEHTWLTRPIASLETTFGRAIAPVTVQLPEWTSVQVDGRLDLAADESLLLAAEDTQLGRAVIVLLRAQPVEAQQMGVDGTGLEER